MATEVVVFDDHEDAVCIYLEAALAARGRPAPVGTQVPADRPPEFVRVMLIGGGRRNLIIDRPMITVEAWAASESAAVELAQLCRGLINAAELSVDGFQVVDPEASSSPVNLPDPDSGHIRYTFTSAADVSGRLL